MDRVMGRIDGTDQEVAGQADEEDACHDVEGGVVGLSRGTPCPRWLAERLVTSCGPSTAANDQAVMTRPWIAPTWTVPKRSRR